MHVFRSACPSVWLEQACSAGAKETEAGRRAGWVPVLACRWGLPEIPFKGFESCTESP